MSLSPEQLEQFMQDGFTTLRGAFPREVAVACREALWQRLEDAGIRRDDPATWVRRKGLDVSFSPQEPPWDGVLSERLTGALDHICGQGRWEEFALGWWVVSFPGQVEGPPGVEGHWHVDGAAHQHYLFSREIGVVLLMYFSDVVEHRGGGTAIAAGSHETVVHSLADAGPKGLTPRQTTAAAIGGGVERVFTTHGQAGDVVIMHPFALHARTKNLADVTPEGVRFLCHPCVALKQHMELNRTNHELYSPLELSIRRVLDRRKAAGTWDRACVDPGVCEAFRKSADNQNESENDKEQEQEKVMYKPETPSAELVETLGFSSFGRKRRQQHQHQQHQQASSATKRAAVSV